MLAQKSSQIMKTWQSNFKVLHMLKRPYGGVIPHCWGCDGADFVNAKFLFEEYE